MSDENDNPCGEGTPPEDETHACDSISNPGTEENGCSDNARGRSNEETAPDEADEGHSLARRGSGADRDLGHDEHALVRTCVPATVESTTVLTPESVADPNGGGKDETHAVAPHFDAQALLHDDSIDAIDQWRSYSDERGQVYYYNHYTGASVWASEWEHDGQAAQNAPAGDADDLTGRVPYPILWEGNWGEMFRLGPSWGGTEYTGVHRRFAEEYCGLGADVESAIVTEDAMEDNFQRMLETPEGQQLLQNEVERLETRILRKAAKRSRQQSVRDVAGSSMLPSLRIIGRRLSKFAGINAEEGKVEMFSSSSSSACSVSDGSLSSSSWEDIQLLNDSAEEKHAELDCGDSWSTGSSSSSSASSLSDSGSLADCFDRPLILDLDSSLAVLRQAMHSLCSSAQAWARYAAQLFWQMLATIISWLHGASVTRSDSHLVSRGERNRN